MYYIKFGKRINMFSVGEFNKYFLNEESMNRYRENFMNTLYDESDYFIIESGSAEFNEAGILEP